MTHAWTAQYAIPGNIRFALKAPQQGVRPYSSRVTGPKGTCGVSYFLQRKM